jgi:hypothetical protein
MARTVILSAVAQFYRKRRILLRAPEDCEDVETALLADDTTSSSPPAYRNYPSDEETRISSSAPSTAIDALLSTPLEQRPPSYSSTPKTPTARGRSLLKPRGSIEGLDAQTVIDTTQNYLVTKEPRRDAELIAPLRAILSSQSGSVMLLPGWLMRLTALVYQKARSRYNVAVLAVDKDFHFTGDSIIADFLVSYDGPLDRWKPKRRDSGASAVDECGDQSDQLPFRVLVFQQGIVVKEDGAGDMFWDWKGNSDRIGDRIVRFRPCV